MTDTDTTPQPQPRRRRWRIWLAVVVTLGAGVGVCVYDGELAAMRGDPILQPLPGAVELARVEVHRSDFLFPTSPRVEVAWGVPGTIEEVTARYLDQFGATHSLRLSLRGDHWRGGGDQDGFKVGVTMTIVSSITEVEWTDERVKDQVIASGWTGVIVVILVT